MTAAPMISLRVLRDLADRIAAPMDPRRFVDLASYIDSLQGEAPASAPIASHVVSFPAEGFAVSNGGAAAAAAPVERFNRSTLEPAPVRIGEVWSTDEMARAVGLLREGKTATDVATALNRPLGATQMAIKRLNLRGDAPPASRMGRYGGQPAPAGAAIDRADAWTPERDAQLREMIAKGETLGQIAATLGRTYEAVRARVKRLRAAGEGISCMRSDWSPAEDAQLMSWRAEGVPFPEIATRMTRTRRACEQRHQKILAKAAGKLVKPRPAGANVLKPAPVRAPDPAPKTESPAALPTPPAKPAPAAPVIAPVPAPPAPSAAKPVPAAPIGKIQTLTRARAILAAAHADRLSAARITVLTHLIGMSEDFTPADDLYLAEGILMRKPQTEMADQLGCEARDIMARWRALLAPSITNIKGHITIDGQADLLAALRWRAAHEAATDA